ncbi:MAG: hypothetical protein NTZ05_01910 [Chloroflexi bacterium]|nr:hypothetical protein [Chloroflexota bacterium]
MPLLWPLAPCPRGCGGNLLYDPDEAEWRCLLCARWWAGEPGQPPTEPQPSRPRLRQGPRSP